jgi:RimJ/RimL family protein N-acetyltransferase
LDEPVFLRPLEREDLERVYRWHNDPSLYASLLGPFRLVSRVTVEEWLLKKAAYSAHEANLAICVTRDSRHIGNIYLRDIDWQSRRAEVHFFIGERDARSRGFGQAALRLLIRHAFGELELSRLFAFALADNLASIRMLERCGFAVEGRLRKHLFKGREARDALVLGLLIEEWDDSHKNARGVV